MWERTVANKKTGLFCDLYRSCAGRQVVKDPALASCEQKELCKPVHPLAVVLRLRAIRLGAGAVCTGVGERVRELFGRSLIANALSAPWSMHSASAMSLAPTPTARTRMPMCLSMGDRGRAFERFCVLFLSLDLVAGVHDEERHHLSDSRARQRRQIRLDVRGCKCAGDSEPEALHERGDCFTRRTRHAS